MTYANFTQVIAEHGRERPDQPCLRFHRDGRWQDLSWGVFQRRVEAVARGLAGLGVAPGERVAIVSANRPEWAIADLGILAAGAVSACVYPTLPAAEIAYILGHSQAVVAFVEDAAMAERVASVRDRVPGLRHVVVLAGEAAGATPLAGLEALGATAASGPLPGLAATRGSPLAIIYTSGTTATPKGVVLTQGNVLGTLESVLAAFGDTSHLRLNLSFLPLAHALERIAGHFLPLLLGRTIAYARSLDTVAEDFRAVRPDFAVAVPRVFEKVHARIQAEARRKPPLARALLRWAVAAGTARSELLERGRRLPAPLRVRCLAADLLVLRRIRAALGGRLALFVSGGAPLAAPVARFFHAAGVLVCEGWGATETSAPATWNTPHAYRFGSVGRPLPGTEVRIAPDGELLVRGPGVFSAYLADPAATAEAFDPEGFYLTGDIGRVDADGFFFITDRKKEIIITAAGKNVAPQKLENLLRGRPGVSNAMVHGDRRRYLVALLTLDRAALAAHHPELASARAGDPALLAAIGAEVEAVNGELARFERVRKFRVVEPDFSPEGGELSLSLKLKRRVVEARHRAVLDAMYAEDPEA